MMARNSLREALHFTRKIFNRAFISLTFLAYPACAGLVMRSFVCTKYRRPSGEDGWWLAADTTVECDVATDPSFAFSSTYAAFMVFFVIVGIPAAALGRLWVWKFPVDYLYTVDNVGRDVPTESGEMELSTGYTLYRRAWWNMAVVEMVFKVVLVSLLGVAFQSNQVAGAFVGGACCALIMAFFGSARPYG
eukprot:g3252.t1